MGKSKCSTVSCVVKRDGAKYGLGLTILVVVLILLVHYAPSPEQPTGIWQECTVQGTSMAPTLVPGDTVYIEHFLPENYAVGDIIVFNMTLFTSSSDNIWIHRVVACTQAYGYFWYMTKGDNNTISDPLLWASYNMNVSEPSWWGRGYVAEFLVLGEVVEIVKGG